MALSKDKLDKIIAGFAFRLAREIPVEEVILFGSYAHGKAKEHSDIDLAIISDWFSDKTRIENMQYLSRVAANYDTLIEALPFTTEEYKNLDKRTFLASIVKSGRRYPLDKIKEKDQGSGLHSSL
jgi:predicted nucleotidyltransferase